MLDRGALLRSALAGLLIVCAPSLGGAAAAASRRPVVAELYTSQGCSACAGADELASDLDGRKHVLVLTFPVDYWDYLGWRDTFAQPAFSQRQRDYAKALGLREVSTPQVVIDGLGQSGKTGPGQSLAQSTDVLIHKAAKARRTGPTIRQTRDKVQIGAGTAPRGGTDVWLVRFRSAPADVTVTAGENRGKTVRYLNVVRELERLGGWSGRARTFEAPQATEGDLKSAILVQAKRGGRILAVLAPAKSQ
ncbi:MAG TPA: DUF1223 domain-containing protein [Caulobacteraceae bacterium]|nr:DUF1223 domain-containing protein [Caulobacteraceae bacterium]